MMTQSYKGPTVAKPTELPPPPPGARQEKPELSVEEKATNNDTFRHIERVRNLLNDCVLELLHRGELHDQSKLEAPEVSVFTEFTAKLAGSTYGSDEYKELLAKMKPALDHHYAKNRHHPEWHDCWECSDCKRVYTSSDVPSVGLPDSEYRWCVDCYGGEYPGFFETALVKRVSVNGMNLIDLLEMKCDWKAASERHADGDIRRSIEINTKRFGLSDQLTQILTNTVDAMFPPSSDQ